MLLVRSATTSPKLLFASSRPLAPACLSKPLPVPETKQSCNTHIKPILPSIPTISEHTNLFKDSPRTGDAHPVFSGPSQAVQLSDPVQVLDDDDLSEEDFSGALQELAHSVGIWEHALQADDGAAAPPPCACHSLPRGSCPEVKQRLVKLISLCCSFGLPNMDGARSSLVNPTFQHSVWREAMGSYFDADEIAKAIQFGWDPSFTTVPYPRDAIRNNTSAIQFPEHVLHYVDKEPDFGSLVGPFSMADLPFKIYRSPFGSVIKVGSEWRRIVVDCSQLSSGINFFIDPRSHRGAPWRLTLPNSMSIIDAIIKTRQRFPGHRVFIWKLDMSRWYRQIQLDPASVKYFAVGWAGKVYLDTCLSFGNRCAALAAQRFIWAVCWIYRTQLPPHQGSYNTGSSCACPFHCECGENIAKPYIDDVMGVSSEPVAADNFSSFLALADHLGLKLSTTPGHISPPGPVCICLGLEYDVDNNTISLPKSKLEALVQLLQDWLVKPTASERELASLSGKLLNACNVFFAGRLFLNRILATKRRAARCFKDYRSKYIYLEEAFREDLRWWLDALLLRNGISFLVHKSTADITLDASSNGWWGHKPGIGAYHFGLNQYISVCPPVHLHDLHISDLELLGHILVARVWGPLMLHQHITVWTDNEACFWLAKNGRSSHDRRLKMARIYAFSQIELEYRAEPAWVSTKDNWVADALSRPASAECRLVWEKFAGSLGASPVQCQITPEMFNF